MELGLEALTDFIETVRSEDIDIVACELLGAGIEYNQASGEFDFAVESLDQAIIAQENIEQLMASMEKYSLEEVVAVIGEKELLAGAGSLVNKEAAMEGLGNRLKLLWQAIIKFIKDMWTAFINFCKRFIAVFRGEKVVVAKLLELANTLEKDKTAVDKVNASTIEVAAPPINELIASMDGMETLGKVLPTLEGKTPTEMVQVVGPIVAKMNATATVEDGKLVIKDNEQQVGGGWKKAIKDFGVDPAALKHLASAAGDMLGAVDQGFNKFLGGKPIVNTDEIIARKQSEAETTAALKAASNSASGFTKTVGWCAHKVQSLMGHAKAIEKATEKSLAEVGEAAKSERAVSLA